VLQAARVAGGLGIQEDPRRDLGAGREHATFVAADIIRTVAVTPTLQSVGALAIIVATRTFPRFTLELEPSGRWPWQKTPEQLR
jgi:hypothetical protein